MLEFFHDEFPNIMGRPVMQYFFQCTECKAIHIRWETEVDDLLVICPCGRIYRRADTNLSQSQVGDRDNSPSLGAG